jgi:4'-phosphopantetheinyl transferase EntD
MYRGGLFPEEVALVAKATAKRREEFTAGRNASRTALASLGAPAQPILRGIHREPLWPNGFVGSITHCDGFCCAVVAQSSKACSLGLDVEEAGPLEEQSAQMVCRLDEFAHFSQLPELPMTNWTKLAFSAKEAFYKCHNPLTGCALEFQDVAVRFTVEAARDAGRFTIALVTHGADSPPLRPRVLGAWLAHGTRIYAAVTHVPAPHIRRSVST